jgi:hypothetical protein
MPDNSVLQTPLTIGILQSLLDLINVPQNFRCDAQLDRTGLYLVAGEHRVQVWGGTIEAFVTAHVQLRALLGK